MKTFNTLSSSTTTGAANNSNAYISLPKTGAHFSVGVNVDYTISKKISLQTGLRYRYLENKLALIVDTTAIYPAYYVTGNQIQYINYSTFRSSIYACKGFVHKIQFGILRQCPGQKHTLLLPAT